MKQTFLLRIAINDELKNKVSFLNSSEVILVENIRFFKEETKNDEEFSKKLGQLGNIYVNDAFSCSHRKQASIHKITKYIKNSFGGPLLKREIDSIDLIVKNKKSPVTCIIGGSKVSTKIDVISNLIRNSENIIIVGAMANNFLIHNKLGHAQSLIEESLLIIIKKILEDGEKFKCKIIVPVDSLIILSN